MSMTLEDVAYEMYMADEGARLLYEEHREQAISEFTSDRLQSYYLDHPDLVLPATRALVDSKTLLETHSGAALVFAAVAIEIGIKSVLLKPVVYGLVHQDSTAALITDLATSHTSFERFRDLLFQILAEHGGIDLRTEKRDEASKPLWEEISNVQAFRNGLLHRGEVIDSERAKIAVRVASTVVDTLIPAVLQHLGLHLHDGTSVCGDPCLLSIDTEY